MSTAHLEKYIKDEITLPLGAVYSLDTQIGGATSKTESFSGETSPITIGNTNYFTVFAGNSTFNTHQTKSEFTDVRDRTTTLPVTEIVDPTSVELNDASYPRVYYVEIDPANDALYNSIKTAGTVIPNTGPHAISKTNNVAVSGKELPLALEKDGKKYIASAIEINGNIKPPDQSLLGGANNYDNLIKAPEVKNFYDLAQNGDPTLRQQIANSDHKFKITGYKQAKQSHDLGSNNIIVPLAANPGPIKSSPPSNANPISTNTVTGPLSTVVEPPQSNAVLPNVAIDDAVNKGVKEFATLVYPLALQKHIGEDIDYLRIQAIEYKPIGTGSVGQKGFLSTDLVRQEPLLSIGPDPIDPANTKTAKSRGLAAKTKNTIILPIPSNIGDSNNVSYTENELDSLSAGLVGLYGNILKDINFGNIGQSAQDVANEFEKYYESSAGALATGINAQIQAQVANLSPFGASNISPESLLTRSTGAILNPNKELLFNGVTTRQFKFSFKLTPRDRQEGIEVKKIIRTLKLNMAPKITRGNNQFLRTPNVFDLSYRRGLKEHPFLHQFKQCALTNMNVNYTGDGVYATYHDSTPVSMVMDLTFKELEPIYDLDYGVVTDPKNSIDKGVGF
tara:strand:+ start:192 stop:2051 length:1860 start_codon:yes stop_codon:yes gene_type:complete